MAIRRLVYTRAIGAEALRSLKVQGIDTIVRAFIEVEGIPFDCPDPEQFDAVAFTSHRSVSEFAGHCKGWKKLPVFALSGKTAATLNEFGIYPELTADNAKALGQKINQTGKTYRILHPGGDLSLPDLELELQSAGHPYRKLAVYSTVLIPHPISEAYDAVAFFSPSAVDAFFSANAFNPDVLYFCIGDTTAEAVEAKFPAAQTIVPERPDPSLLLKKIISYSKY